MRNVLLVGLGGFAGSVARYLVQLLLAGPAARVGFPLATLAVNVLGSLAIGLLLGSASREALDERTRLLVATGVLGGFTTWSAFAWETVSLAGRRDPAPLPTAAFLNVALHLALGLLATWVGMRLARPAGG